MQAIATLIEDDPYLKTSKDERITSRRERRSRLFGSYCAFEVEAELPKVQAEPKPESEPPASEMDAWVERQKNKFKEPWFSIETEIDPPEPVMPRIETIQKVVAKYYGLSRNDLICARRTQRVVMPRHIAMTLCRALTMKSYPEIGRRFGRRDHTVPLYACRKIDQLAKIDPVIAADMDALKALLVVQS